jgi:DNA-binding IclR family transcriptional regulator
MPATQAWPLFMKAAFSAIGTALPLFCLAMGRRLLAAQARADEERPQYRPYAKAARPPNAFTCQ